VDCQVSTFFATAARPEGLPDEESRTRHVPSEGALSGLNVGVSPVFLSGVERPSFAHAGRFATSTAPP